MDATLAVMRSAIRSRFTTCLFHYAPFHWAVGTFQCTRFARTVVVVFYFRLHLAYFFRPAVAIVADGLFCREIDGLFCRSSPDIIVRRRCVLSHKRRGWLEPSPSFRYSRNLALQDELYHPVINNGPAVLVCVDKRLGTGPVNQSRDAG